MTQVVPTDANFFANDFQTACKRSSVGKRKAVSVHCPVNGPFSVKRILGLIFGTYMLGSI